MLDYMPYLVSIVTALIAYYQSNKQAKLKVEEMKKQTDNEIVKLKEENIAEIEKMQKVTESEIIKLVEQHKINIEHLKEVHRLELEKKQLEQSHKIEIMEKEKELRVSEAKDTLDNKALDNMLNRVGVGVINDFMKTPEIQEKLRKSMKL